ncbi:CcmD family protein [Marinoscillum sp. MHG1-6]|uniref:CcmD family protein n=1 Tax=Marinoscillum sp. MHG1-6 TaxID=2959627 RepID=UPI0021587017|nr:CcmD family protein [Marinoscillum sp. MHG1-6]
MINLLTILSLLLQVPMADTFRSDGKIYVVIAIILIILLGMFFYLFRLDKKIGQIEEELKDKEK